MYRIILLLLLPLAFISCGSNGDGGTTQGSGGQIATCESNSGDPVIGCWHSEACAQNATDPSVYAQGILNFHNNGSIDIGMNWFKTSDCSGTPYYTDPGRTDTYVNDSTTLSSGGLNSIIMALTESGFTIYTAYYMPANDRLCFLTGDYVINETGGGLVPPPRFTKPTVFSINTAQNACLIP